MAVKPGYISVSANMDLEKLDKYTELNRDLYLTPIEEGQRIVLNNLFFDYDKAEIKKESYPELDRLSKLLQTNNALKIEIGGYTDSRGSEAYNDVLSKRRAEAVANYLVKKSGVGEKRISVQHYGENNPTADNSTAEGRQQNRRVEFKILSK